MRASVASLSRKFINAVFAATLALGLVPAAAFAAPEAEYLDAADVVAESENLANDANLSEGDEALQAEESPDAEAAESEPSDEVVDDAQPDIPALDVINQDMLLETVVAQAESTRSYFLAQTLENTRTVPIVSAKLPLDTGSNANNGTSSDASFDAVGDASGEPTDQPEGSSEDEGGEDSDESDLGDVSQDGAIAISPDSVVVGSFEYMGVIYAMEPGGETVAAVAADYSKLPQEFIDAQVIVLPEAAMASDGDIYSVTRIADEAFASLTAEAQSSSGAANEAAGDAADAEPTADGDDESDGSLIALYIPASVNNIEDNAFTGFSTLQYIVVDEANPEYASYDGCLYDAQLRRLLSIPEGRSGAVRVAPSAEEVDPEVFSHCPSVDTISADPASAAYQLITENAEEYKNANGEQIKLIVMQDVEQDDFFKISDAIREFVSETQEDESDILSRLQNGSSTRQFYYKMPGQTSYTAITGSCSCATDQGYTFVGKSGSSVCFKTGSTCPGHGLINTGRTDFQWRQAYSGVESAMTDWNSSGYVNFYSSMQIYIEIRFPTVTIQWNANGTGAVSSPTQSTVNQGSKIGTLASATRDGYDFLGWFTAANGGTQVNASTAVTANVTYYAHWTPHRYKLEFNHAEGTGGPSGYLVRDADLPINTQLAANEMPTRTGYEFGGYYELKEDGSRNFWYDEDGKLITPTNGNSYGGYPLTHDVTLYAEWTRNDVKLDANNGSGTQFPVGTYVTWDQMVPRIVGLNSASDLDPYLPVPQDQYKFGGFYTQPVGGAQYYDANLTPVATFSEDVDTLYAHWIDLRYEHNFLNCSLGGETDDEGYAYGWTCEHYESYVARVYVNRAATSEDEEYVPGVPADAQQFSGKISAEAVKAGEYYLVAGGKGTTEGTLPADAMGMAKGTGGGSAWWEITSEVAGGYGTLRIHCDRGSVINITMSGTIDVKTGSHTYWRQPQYYKLAREIIFDHADFWNASMAFAALDQTAALDDSWALKSVQMVGNTMFPNCTEFNSVFTHTKFYSFSDNFTFRGTTNLENAWGTISYAPLLGSLPSGFTYKGSKAYEFGKWLEECPSIKSLPDGFMLSDKATESLSGSGTSMEISNRSESTGHAWQAADYWTLLGQYGQLSSGTTGRLLTYYAGSDSTRFKPFVETACSARRQLVNSSSVTFDARGGSFSSSSPYDCSRVYALSGDAAIPSAPTRTYVEADGTVKEDAFLGWYKKVEAFEGSKYHYLYNWEFAFDATAAGQTRTLSSVLGSAVPTETTVYYALYESDADSMFNSLSSNITFDANDGSGQVCGSLSGQEFGKAMQELPMAVPSHGNMVFDGFWTQAQGGKQYYDASGAPVAGVTWAEPQTNAVLYAHWRDPQVEHDHVYCSQGIQFDEDGFAYGWTCPSWDTYVAKVYVAGTPSSLDEENVPDVPAGLRAALDGVVSADAVKAGEYYLIAGGRNAAGVLPTTSNPSADVAKLDAWWEITASSPDDRGTFRLHCDRGAIIDIPLLSFTNHGPMANQSYWRAEEAFYNVDSVILDHVDCTTMKHWFAGLSGSPYIEFSAESFELLGNTFPPSCSYLEGSFWSATRLSELSDNFTFRGASSLGEVQWVLGQNFSLASLPAGFTFAGASNVSAIRNFLEDAASIQSLPDGMEFPTLNPSDGVSSTHGAVTSNILAMDNYPNGSLRPTDGIIHTTSYRQTTGKSSVYFHGADYSKLNNYLTNTVHKQTENTYPTLINASSITWDGRSGAFDQDYTYDCSRVNALPSSSITIPASPKRTYDPDNEFIGWFKKVPMTGTGHDGEIEANGKTWAENRYLYQYEFVCGAEDAGKSLAEVLGAGNVPSETTVYYAMYESDADKFKSRIELRVNNGTSAVHKVINDQMYGEAMNEDAGVPSFGAQNYEFDGFWTEPLGGTQYYTAAGTPVEGITWREGSTNAVLYAHWKYRITLDSNVRGFVNSAGETVEATIDWDSIPQSGAGFAVVRPAEGEEGEPYIDALFGAAIPLPTASREGYGDTRAWGLSAGAGNEGKASWVMRLTSDGWSAAADGTKVSPESAQYLRNGAGASDYYFNPTPDDYTVLLYANWIWDSSVSEADKPQPAGGKSTFTVRLKASYTESRIAFAAAGAWASSDGIVLDDVEYDAVIPAAKLAGLSAPQFASATGYERLVFKGFSTQPSVPEPAAGASTTARTLIEPSAADDTKLSATNELMRLAPESGEVVLYAIWALPKTDVLFHLNTDGLEAQLTYAEAKASDDLAQAASGGAFTVTAETNKPTPAVSGLAVPRNGAYEFNGWWTHPYLERGTDSVQYYDEFNQVVKDSDGEALKWAPYGDTVLYAHWRYTVEFNANPTGHSGGSAEVRHKGAQMPSSPVVGTVGEYQVDAWGNRYFYEDLGATPADLRITRIEAVAGAPLKLPYATNRVTDAGVAAGYDDTCQWRVAARPSESAPILPVDADGFTLAAAGGAKAKPAVAPGEGGVVTLFADWTDKAHEYEVTFAAGTGALKDERTTWTDEVRDGVTFDATLWEAGVQSVGVPLKHGWTFTGFYADDGTQYVDAKGIPISGKYWAETAAAGSDGTRKVTLQAKWVQDVYRVVYDLKLPSEGSSALAEKTPGAQTVAGGTPTASTSWYYGSAYAHDGGSFHVAEKDDVGASTSSFFRNGYDFQGWYWIDDSAGAPQAVMACSSDGTTRGAFRPSLAWQQAHKGGLADDGAAKPATITLYAAWEAKVYGLVFEMGYNEQDDVAYPTDSMMGMTAPNTVARDHASGTYYYEVAYEQPITPFFTGSGADAVAAKPTDDPWKFINWTVKDGQGEGNVLFGDDSDAATEPTLSGAFLPTYPLSTRDIDHGVITFQGQWQATSPVKVTLSAGDASRGSFVTSKFSEISEEYRSTPMDARTITLKDVPYQLPFEFMDEHSPYRPKVEAGYTFVGYVKTDAEGRPLDANGEVFAESIYDNGNPRRGLNILSSMTKLKEDTRVEAVYSRNSMQVRLNMSGIPQHAGYAKYTFQTKVDDGYSQGWIINGAAYSGLVYDFDVTAAAFRLPDDVIVPGYRFVGWERETPSGVGAVPEVIDPKVIAASSNLSSQTFKPVFEAKTYEVSFLPNHPAGHEGGGAQKVTIDFEGKIVDAGDFAGEPGFEVGSVLSMADVPEADVAVTDSAHTDGELDENHYHSYPFSLWRIGNSASTQVDKQERLAGQAVTSAEWSRWIDRFVKVEPGTKRAVESLPIYGIWSTVISAVLPLQATVALDADTGSVAMADESYKVYGVGLQAGERLEVAELRYESLTATGAAGDNALSVSTGEPVRLTLFPDAATKPELLMPSVTDGVFSGDFGLSAFEKEPLQIDLSAGKAAFDKDELEAHGFRPFTTADGSPSWLQMRFGLNLNGVSVEAARLLKAGLIDPTAERGENGWTVDAVPVAKLCYTVQMVK